MVKLRHIFFNIWFFIYFISKVNMVDTDCVIATIHQSSETYVGDGDDEDDSYITEIAYSGAKKCASRFDTSEIVIFFNGNKSLFVLRE